MKLPIGLVQLVPAEDQEEFFQQFRGCHYVRSILVKFFERELQALVEEDEGIDAGKTYNYTEALADNRGARRRLRKVINILKEGIPHADEEEEG